MPTRFFVTDVQRTKNGAHMYYNIMGVPVNQAEVHIKRVNGGGDH